MVNTEDPTVLASPAIPLTVHNYDLRNSIGYLLKLNSKIIAQLAEDAFVTDSNLSFVQFISIMLVRDGIASTPGDLTRLLGYNSGAITRIIDKLEEAGLVTRTRRDRDRRSIALAITPGGAAAVSRLLPILLALWNSVLSGFTPEEYVELVRLQRKLLIASLQPLRIP